MQNSKECVTLSHDITLVLHFSLIVMFYYQFSLPHHNEKFCVGLSVLYGVVVDVACNMNVLNK